MCVSTSAVVPRRVAAGRHPAAEQGGWDLDTYAARVLAIDTVRETAGNDDVNVIGFCAGGIIATTLLNHLAATGDEAELMTAIGNATGGNTILAGRPWLQRHVRSCST